MIKDAIIIFISVIFFIIDFQKILPLEKDRKAFYS